MTSNEKGCLFLDTVHITVPIQICSPPAWTHLQVSWLSAPWASSGQCPRCVHQVPSQLEVGVSVPSQRSLLLVSQPTPFSHPAGPGVGISSTASSVSNHCSSWLFCTHTWLNKPCINNPPGIILP